MLPWDVREQVNRCWCDIFYNVAKASDFSYTTRMKTSPLVRSILSTVSSNINSTRFIYFINQFYQIVSRAKVVVEEVHETHTWSPRRGIFAILGYEYVYSLTYRILLQIVQLQSEHLPGFNFAVASSMRDGPVRGLRPAFVELNSAVENVLLVWVGLAFYTYMMESGSTNTENDPCHRVRTTKVLRSNMQRVYKR